jgi:hypothetical protein
MIEKPVAWRWKPKDSSTWIYDPKVEWLNAQNDVDKEPLFTESQLKAERERAIREVAEHVRYLMLCPVSGTKEPSEVEASILKLIDN